MACRLSVFLRPQKCVLVVGWPSIPSVIGKEAPGWAKGVDGWKGGRRLPHSPSFVLLHIGTIGVSGSSFGLLFHCKYHHLRSDFHHCRVYPNPFGLEVGLDDKISLVGRRWTSNYCETWVFNGVVVGVQHPIIQGTSNGVVLD